MSEEKNRIFSRQSRKIFEVSNSETFFKLYFLDWYYQNGKTLIRDYSIPDQRSGFNTRFCIKIPMESRYWKPTQRCGQCHVTTNKTLEKEVDAIFISNGPYLSWLHHRTLPPTRPQVSFQINF